MLISWEVRDADQNSVTRKLSLWYLPSVTTWHEPTHGMGSTHVWRFHLSLTSSLCTSEIVLARIFFFCFLRKWIQCWFFLEHGPNSTVSWKNPCNLRNAVGNTLIWALTKCTSPSPLLLCAHLMPSEWYCFALKHLSWMFTYESHPKPF